MIEAHYAVPMLGAVLNPLNTRLDAGNVAFSLKHGAAKVLIVDGDYAPLVKQALALLDRDIMVIDIDAPEPAHPPVGTHNYEALLAAADPAFRWPGISDEWQSLCLLYPVHVITRKSLGEMTRKLSVTESHSPAQFLGTVSRRNPRVASANSRHVA